MAVVYSAQRELMRSHNLRALTRYPRERGTFATRISIYRRATRCGANVDITFYDGAVGTARFESARVAREWAFMRTWHNPHFKHAGIQDITIEKDGRMRPTMMPDTESA